MKRSTCLLADDQPKFLQLLESLLTSDVEVIGIVSDGQALVDAFRRLKPDLIITDISMPIMNGIEAVESLRRMDCNSKIIFLTVHSGYDFVRRCLDLGAGGYVLKSRVATELLPAIREVQAGGTFVSPGAGEQPGTELTDSGGDL